jgi:hypothetical protein
MPLFIVLIVGAMLCGAGAMLAPALPTLQPRVGLAATLTLALIIGGSLFMLSLTANDPLVIDYVLFALLSGTVLGGTIAQAQTRAEEKGEELSDADQGWTGPQDILFFALVGVIFAGLLVIAHPFQTGASSAGMEMMTSYVGRQLQQTRPIVQRALAAIVAFLAVWVFYDLGSEWQSKPLGRCMALASLPVLMALYVRGEFTVLMGVLFGAAYLLFLMRAIHTGQRLDILGAGLMFGACLYASVDAFFTLIFVTPVWMALSRRFPPQKIEDAISRRWVWTIPVIAVLATLPWWVTHIQTVGMGLYNLFRAFDGAILLIATLVIACAGGWMLWTLWQRVPTDLRATLRRSYYPLAVVLGGGLLVGIVVLRGA